MEPPRKPREEDSAKRKQELTDQHKAEPREPTLTPQELSELENLFRDF